MFMTRNNSQKIKDFLESAGIGSLQEISPDLNSQPHKQSFTAQAAPDPAPRQKKCRKIQPKQQNKEQPPLKIDKKARVALKKAAKAVEKQEGNVTMPALQPSYRIQPSLLSLKNAVIYDKSTSALSPDVEEHPPNLVHDQFSQQHRPPSLPAISTYNFPICINKSLNKFYGYFGHASVLTGIPVIEGSYYIEFKILPSSRLANNAAERNSFVKNSSVTEQLLPVYFRVGICKKDYKLLVPLGGLSSYAYKSKDGAIVHNNTIDPVHKGQPFQEGDVIGVYLHLEPPIPLDKSERNSPPRDAAQIQVNEGSLLAFFKNGKETCRIQNIEQAMYVFGGSLFNWANIQINQGPVFQMPPEGLVQSRGIPSISSSPLREGEPQENHPKQLKYFAYCKAKEQKIPYKDMSRFS